MWTNEQLDAITAPVSNLLVTAAAGSGKTAVMVERILQRILKKDGTDIDKLLIVTYTNAAASEIRERIQMRIMEAQSEMGDNRRLDRQLALIDNASICTIHSFCLDIIRTYYHLLDIDPGFRTGDALEIELMMAQAADEVLDAAYEANDPVFLQLVDAFTKRNDDPLAAIIRRMYTFSCSMPEPDAWLDMLCVRYETGNTAPYTAAILQKAAFLAKDAAAMYAAAIRTLQKAEHAEAYIAFLNVEKAQAEALAAHCTNWDETYWNLCAFEFGRRGHHLVKEIPDIEAVERADNLRKAAKDIIKKELSKLISMPEAEICADFLKMAPLVRTLVELVKLFHGKYLEIKKKKNVIDFLDYEQFALQILRDGTGRKSAAAKEISARYEEIYVDECQDCNGVQDRIFSLISTMDEGHPNLFMVGDIKQSIYKFRDAAPMLFLSKMKAYTPYKSGQDIPYAKILLNKNFRSRKEVLCGVNALFSQIMSETVGEMEYGPDEYLNPNEDAPYTCEEEFYKTIDVLMVDWSKNIPEEETEGEPSTKLQAEADVIAQKIDEIIKSGVPVFDKGTGEFRPVQYRDIVILMRSAKASSDVFLSALSQKAIPAYSDVSDSYFDTQEISTLLSLLTIAINPMDDIHLAAVLRSGIFGFSDSELFEIRLFFQGGFLYDAMCRYEFEVQTPLAGKIRRFLKTLSDYREKVKTMPADAFLWYVTEDSGYMRYLSTLPMAEQKKANVRALFTKAAQFEETDYKGAFHFARFVDRIKSRSGDSDAPGIVGENENVVRIMTIHKSKGLEFPIVFLAQCAKRFNFDDTKGDFLLHKSLGLGIHYVDLEKRFSYPLLTKLAIRETMRLESLSEEMRILYVAMTRAREKLFLSGVLPNAEESLAVLRASLEDTSKHQLEVRIVQNAACYFDWILPAIVHLTGTVKEKSFQMCTMLPPAGTAKNHSQPSAPRFAFDEIKPGSAYSSNYSEVCRRLDFAYPYFDSIAVPSNITVTEIKRMHENMQEGYPLYAKPKAASPAFLEADSKDAARRGTVMHFVMQKIDLKHPVTPESVTALLESLVADAFITQQDAAMVDITKICHFFETPVGITMRQSAQVFREFPFKIKVPANRVFSNVSKTSAETVVVQGAIDAYFDDGQGGFVLVDYKTDRVRNGTEEIRRRYEIQVKLYRAALEQLAGRPVRNCCLYLFDTGETIQYEKGEE